MANRLDIELTSKRSDGVWTWRVKGARQPKGVVDSSLLPAGSKVGDLLRVEAEIYMDGISIANVLLPKETTLNKESEIIPRSGLNSGLEFPLVTTTYATSGRLDTALKDRNERPSRHKSKSPRVSKSGESLTSSVPRKDRLNRGGQDRPDKGSEENPTIKSHGLRKGTGLTRNSEGRSSNNRRSVTLNKIDDFYRKAFLDSLSLEQRAIADKLVAGGLPAVRKAIEEQNRTAMTSNLPKVPEEPIIQMAEGLLPKLKVATWCDRAQGALKAINDITALDLRSLISSSEAAQRDSVGGELLSKLRDALNAKLLQARNNWENSIRDLLAEGQIIRALKLSSNLPDNAARLPGELANSLAHATSQAMNSQVPPQRWALLLEAAASSSVRINVRPAGLPADADEELIGTAKKLAGRIPALARMLGITLPPPPTPLLKTSALPTKS